MGEFTFARRLRNVASLVLALSATTAAQAAPGESAGGTAGTFIERQKLLPVELSSDAEFGESVAMHGTTLVVGAPGDGDNGSAYVFSRGDGGWTQQQKLRASDDDGDFGSFGISVAIAGDTIAVGAYNDDIGDNRNQGSVYVFVRSGGVWSEQQKLIASDGGVDDQLGHSVALQGDTIAAGAIQDSNFSDQLGPGAVYIFTRSSVTWTEQTIVTADDGVLEDEFGFAVALDGNTLAVGARNGQFSGKEQGSVYLFTGSGGSWSQQQKLTVGSDDDDDDFGFSVALDGDRLAVGAPGDDAFGQIARGSAYVFRRNGGTWGDQVQLTASDGAEVDFFGLSVALDGDRLVVGADNDNVDDNVDQGSAYVFNRIGNTWTEQQKLVASDGEAQDEFADAMALQGNVLVIGADQDFINGAGAAYAFGLQPLVRLSSITGELAEGGAAVELSAQLDLVSRQPVTVSLEFAGSASLDADYSVSASRIVVPANSLGASLSLSGLADSVFDPDETVLVGISAITNAAEAGDQQLVFTIGDRNVPISVSPVSGLVTSEDGTEVDFSVSLDTQPTADVTIPLGSTDSSEGTLSRSSLVFTSSDWSTAQTVKVTGKDDDEQDGDWVYSVITEAAISSDPQFNGLNPPDVEITNLDNDGADPNILMIYANPFDKQTSELGDTAELLIKLTTQPGADVTVSVASNDPTEGAVSPASVTFTQTDWSKPQTITVIGQNDTIADGDQDYLVSTTDVQSSDQAYASVGPVGVSVSNLDDEAGSIPAFADGFE